MPSGIIMSSGSQGASDDERKQQIEKVLEANGYETEKPEPTVEEPVEPKRDDFDSDEEFEKAQDEFEAAQEEAAEKEAEREEREEAERQKKQEERHPRLSRRQRAIDKATAKLQEDLRKANERLAALEAGGKKPAAEQKVEAPKAPKREDFKSDAEFDDAMFDYRYKLRRAKEQADEAKSSIEARHRENLSSYQSQVAAFKEEHDDWDEVVNQPIPIHESVQLAIIELENGAQVTYYLGKHPDYARDLAELSPLKAVVEIGRLADKLKPAGRRAAATTEDKSGKPKPKPKALPEPVKPVSTSATSSTLSSKEAAAKRDFRAFKAAQRRGA